MRDALTDFLDAMDAMSAAENSIAFADAERRYKAALARLRAFARRTAA